MRQFLIAAVTCSLLGCGPAFAQVGMITGAPASLGVTSPLGLGPGAPVGATGIPLGATELSTPGVSPNAAGTAALGSMTASTACSGIGASAQSTTSIPGTVRHGDVPRDRYSRLGDSRRAGTNSLVRTPRACREMPPAHAPAAPR